MSLQENLKIVIVGHVDHGKSTLIGRLFYDTGSIPESRYQEIERTCAQQGRPFEFAYLMDALEEEREQNVTIDTAQSFFKTARRPYVIIDAPGHKEFLKNMITGAASADAAILLLDGVEGVREQTRRHAYILSLLGIRQVIVAINKLDKANYDRNVFQQAENDIRSFLHPLGIIPSYVIPISARDGENMARKSVHTPWYHGPSLLEALDTFETVRAGAGLALRFPVQDVYKWDGARIYAGRLESGTIRVGDDVTFLPSGRRTTVKSIEKWQQPGLEQAVAGECIGLTFHDDLYVERGEVLARTDNLPTAAQEISASVFWLAGQPLERGRTYRLKLATAEVEATLVDIEERLDSSTLEVSERHAQELLTTEAGNVIFALKKPLAADTYLENASLGRFVIESGAFIGGGGIIRTLRSKAGSSAQIIDLQGFAQRQKLEPIDLSRASGQLEFRVSPDFLDALDQGAEVTFRLRGPRQIEHVALLAYEHHLDFRFQRNQEGVYLHLYRRPSNEVLLHAS